MATLNATPVRLDNGGVLLIGADDVLELKPGSWLEWTPCVYMNIDRDDRDIPQAPLEGKLERGTIKLTCRAAASPTTSLYATLMAAGASPPAQKEFTITVKIPTYRGAATGKSYTFATVCFDREKTRYSQGQESDEVSFEGKYRTAGPTEATY